MARGAVEMGRPPSPKKQKQLAVALPLETRNYLTLAANHSGHSVAEEIRRRIDQTIRWQSDAPTLELLEGVVNLAAMLREDFGYEWHRSPIAHEAFVVAVNQRLAGYTPPPREGPAASSDLFALSKEPPETIGRLRERDDWQRNRYPLLLEALERRGKSLKRVLAAGLKARKANESDTRKGKG